jgi:excisionase family DNA binding protein
MIATETGINFTGLSTNVTLEPLLKIEEAAQIVGRSHWTLRNDIKAGKIRCVRFGRRIMIERSEIRKLIESGRR